MLEKLMNNPYILLISFVLGVFGTAFAIYEHYFNKERKEITYRRFTNSLIIKKKSKFEKLDIKYDGNPIDDFAVSRILLWNSGNRTIIFDDMVPTKELSIEMKEGESILDYGILFSSEKTNEFSIEKINDNRIIVKFDYIDQNDGVVVQILHTGTQEDIKISCKIKGGLPIRKYTQVIQVATTKEMTIRQQIAKGLFGIIMWGLLALAALMLFIIDLISYFAHGFLNRNATGLDVLTSFVLSFFSGLFVIKLSFDTLFLRMPKSLRPYAYDSKQE